MNLHIGLDISQRKTAICVVNDKGTIVVEGSSLTLPNDIHSWLLGKAIDLTLVQGVCLEAGALSSFIYKGLEALGFPVVCVEAFQAHQFLKAQRNKTDRNDARGLAQFMRMGGDYIRPVVVKDTITQEDRMLLTLRQKYVKQKVAIENAITGILKPFGIIVPRRMRSSNSFCNAYTETVAKAEALGPTLREAVLESLDAYRAINVLLDKITKQIQRVAMEHPVCRRLMTAPGVGPIVALSFVTAVDTPHRFRKSEHIGGYLGLTPRKYQSGDVDHSVGISKFGSSMTRVHLVHAATSLLYHSKKWSSLRAWGMKVAKRRGYHIARIAVARKLAIVLHRMWITEQDFRWSMDGGDDTGGNQCRMNESSGKVSPYGDKAATAINKTMPSVKPNARDIDLPIAVLPCTGLSPGNQLAAP
jgi:transposase